MPDSNEPQANTDAASPISASMDRLDVVGRLGGITDLLRERVVEIVAEPPALQRDPDTEREETNNAVARKRFAEFRDQWTALADADRMPEADDLLDQLFVYFRERELYRDNDDNFLMKHGFNMFIRNEDPRFLQAIAARFTERPDAVAPHNQDLVSKAHEFGARHLRVRGTTLLEDEQTAEAGRRLIEQARETLRELIKIYEERKEFGSACRAAYETAYTFVPQERWGEAHLYFRISEQMAEQDPKETLGLLIARNEANWALKMGGTLPSAELMDGYREFTAAVRKLAAEGNPTAKRWVSNALHEQGATALEIAQNKLNEYRVTETQFYQLEALDCCNAITDDRGGYLTELDEERTIQKKAAELWSKTMGLKVKDE